MWVLQTVHRKFYKGLTRNPEIGNTTEFCPICRDWGKLGITILAWMSLMKCCWRLQNVKCYSFYRFWVFKEKPTGEGGKITPSLPSRSKSNRLKDWNRHECCSKMHYVKPLLPLVIRRIRLRYSIKWMFLEILQNLQENN